MEDFKKLEKSQLVDLLTRETDRYYKLSKNGGSKRDYEDCKKIIKEIQAELEVRKKLIK